MDRIQNIKQEIENIKKLRKDYESLVSEPNNRYALEAYHGWYEASCILFSRYFGDDSKEYVNFTSIDNSGNGFVLYNNYQGIRKDFCVLIDKLERGYLGQKQLSAIEQISQTQPSSKKRIFISHASKDKELINKFVDSIILLGMGVDSNIIAYTSREDTGVPPGESIPQFIQDNIACADIVLLMISDNYKSSEVCLNEMGAAWALNKYIIQILLPNISFDKLGWICSLEKALKIDETESMDSLCEAFSDRLNIGIKPSVWNRNKIPFISYCKSLTNSLSPAITEPIVIEEVDKEEELGFLDYRERLDKEVANISSTCLILSGAILKHNKMINTNTIRLQRINSFQPNVSQTKGILISTAKGMDELSIIFENKTLLLQSSFFNMIDNGMKMIALIMTGCEEDMQKDYNAVSKLLKSISEAKSGCMSFKEALDAIPKAEQTINKSKKRLSNNLDHIIVVLDECISKGYELLKLIL
ncbi:MAG: toll/interleukin-1 receptor domain-containing protein [Bacteroidaceae bacterium]|nr:toll/interleukin-1 receptor domain-containing protein [Bacteroidaceae bacterium]